MPRFPDNQQMKVVRLSAISTGRLYPQEKFQVLISVTVRVNARAIMWPEGLSQRKIPVTPSAIKPAVTQYLNQLCLHVPHLGHTLPENASINELLYQKTKYTIFL